MHCRAGRDLRRQQRAGTGTFGRLVLSLLLHVTQRIEATLHHRPQINHDLISCFATGTSILIHQAIVHNGDEIHDAIEQFARVSGKVVHLAGIDVLDQKVQYYRVVVVLLVNHRLDVRCLFCNAQIVQCDPTGRATGKLE